jgi:outer membrane protein OmpA-like peptidoglycan-associated protein
LKLRPGAIIAFPVHQAVDQQGKTKPDYTMVVQIEGPSEAAYSFKWSMTDPINASGVRAVDKVSARSSHKVSFFYAPGQNCTLVGYTNPVCLSDAMYQDLKTKRSTAFDCDGPYAVLGRGQKTIKLPTSITVEAEEALPIQVDEKNGSVRTLKAVADNGWTYWILDNPKWPMIVKGTGPFGWDEAIITNDGIIDGADKSGGQREGRRIVNELKKKGIATTWAILFDFDSDKLKPSATPILNEVVNYLKNGSSIKLAVQGHCDIVGGYDYNMDLSRRRANSVKQFMVKAGVADSRLKSEGYGWTKPIATNKTAAGRSKNRRVVFKVLAK